MRVRGDNEICRTCCLISECYQRNSVTRKADRFIAMRIKRRQSSPDVVVLRLQRRSSVRHRGRARRSRVRLGVGLNALGLFLYAGVPVVLGIACRGMFPALADSQQALPIILVKALPPLVGAVGLAAVFSAEISAADAVLLMLTTSLSRDLYKQFVSPDANDASVLRIARWATLVSAVLGVAFAITAASIVLLLTIFYTLLTVSLLVPIVAGLFVPRTTARDALASIVAGVSGMLIIQVATHGRGWGLVTPALGGLAAAVTAWAIASVAYRLRTHQV
jgi:solute:Na+ symporter, SSS family